MTNILYTYNIQIHNKAAIFLINIDTFFYIIESYKLRVDLQVWNKMDGFYNNSVYIFVS